MWGRGSTRPMALLNQTVLDGDSPGNRFWPVRHGNGPVEPGPYGRIARSIRCGCAIADTASH